MSQMIEFKRPDGQTAQGWLVEPAQPQGAPGLVLIQEWWGLNDQIKGVARAYAQAGYRVLVPDLYRGQSTVEAEEAEHLMNALDFADAASQDIRGAVLHLQASGSTKLGVTGYCMGGALTLLSACFSPELAAAVAWYGFPPLEYIDATKIRAAVMGHFATQDAFFPVATVPVLEAKLKDAGVSTTFHTYEAMHAFANETQVDPQRVPTNRYDAQTAALAMERTLAFLRQHLG